MEHVDRAVLLVERYGTVEDKAALSDAINILRHVVDHTDRVAQRKAIIAIADNRSARLMLGAPSHPATDLSQGCRKKNKAHRKARCRRRHHISERD